MHPLRREPAGAVAGDTGDAGDAGDASASASDDENANGNHADDAESGSDCATGAAVAIAVRATTDPNAGSTATCDGNHTGSIAAAAAGDTDTGTARSIELWRVPGDGGLALLVASGVRRGAAAPTRSAAALDARASLDDATGRHAAVSTRGVCAAYATRRRVAV